MPLLVAAHRVAMDTSFPLQINPANQSWLHRAYGNCFQAVSLMSLNVKLFLKGRRSGQLKGGVRVQLPFIPLFHWCLSSVHNTEDHIKLCASLSTCMSFLNYIPHCWGLNYFSGRTPNRSWNNKGWRSSRCIRHPSLFFWITSSGNCMELIFETSTRRVCIYLKHKFVL